MTGRPKLVLASGSPRRVSLLNQAGMARSLADLKVDPKSIPTMAQEAHAQWTRNFNPREVSVSDLERLYAESFIPRGNGDARG